MGRGYRRQHEFIGYWGALDSTTESDVWDIARARNYEHPTEKPPALARRAIENSTKPGGRIWSPFGGSGDALIAAEQSGRTCFAMELKPGYVDVIRRRYAEFVNDPSLAP